MNFQNKTRGLLGSWTWDMGDDFTLPDGRVVGANLNNFESTHRDFAMHCKLTFIFGRINNFFFVFFY